METWNAWRGITVRDAVPIEPYYTTRLQPKTLQYYIHIWEPFGGMSYSGAIMHLEARNNIGTYTHSDIDQDARDITRATLPKL